MSRKTNRSRRYPLINKDWVRDFALECCKDRYATRNYSRVSARFYRDANNHLKEFIRRRVNEHPSIGKTLT